MTDDEPVAAIDLRQVLAEIDQEVRARRRSGELPEDFERSLDAAFARYAPVDAVSDNLDTLLAKLEESAALDTRAPIESRHRGVQYLKVAIGRAIDWDLRHLADQASGMLVALSRALRLVADRLDTLERDTPSAAESLILTTGLSAGRHIPPPGDWVPTVRQHLPADGRVVHVECGDGWLVGPLQAAGVDAYGADPDERLVLAAPAEVVDLRVDPAVDHLMALPATGLAGVVLSNCVDRLTAGAIVELVDVARSRLRAGGTLVVISHVPEHWGHGPQAVLADLAPGRPWRPGTWERVLADRGWHGPLVHPVSREGYAVTATR